MIGGWAYNRYAEPRFTGDIDFFVATDDRNQALLRRVLTRFGFGGVLPPTTESLFATGEVIMLGRPPHRIDLIAAISGVAFDEAWSERVKGSLDGLPVQFISRRLLLKNKRAAGRLTDLADKRWKP